ncbi:MAG: pyridoxamine 5'-phosphate oxidase family protein [Methanobacterium sp.]|nr:pyridoxamine 5'-phosphate oxidase family protein [Methanobacterium sp.]
MDILKIPPMEKKEYDKFIDEQYVSRIAFKGDYPYIAPFLYVFNGKFIYFLSTKYGKKVELIKSDPQVAVEIEKYNSDLSQYRFVTLRGQIKEVISEEEKMDVKGMFVKLIKEKDLSLNVMAALGYSPQDPPESILNGEKCYVWKLVNVKEIVALKNS